jgi:cytochrome c oxidase subunit 2
MSRLLQCLVLGSSLLFGTAACSSQVGGGPGIPTQPSIFDPQSPDARALTDLTWLLHIIMVLVFLGVLAAVLLFAYRYRARSDDQQGRRIFGHTKLEIGWTAAPALVVLAVFVLSLNIMCSVDVPVGSADESLGDALPAAVRVQAIGRQWWWEYRLPDHAVVTANELHLPVGQRATLELLADDVIHDWWVPQLAGKRDMVPGHVNYLSFVPVRAGVYGGVCAEFCGIQHAWMRTRVVVETPEQFQAWVQRLATPAIPPTSGLEATGARVFIARNCQACHTIDGYVQATAEAGPNLTHVASREILAAGRLTNTPENMAQWIRAPQELKPGNLMPTIRMTEEEIAALTAFMLSLR